MILARHVVPVLALSLTLVPDESEACDPAVCSNADLWMSLGPVNSSQVPSDGVLVLQGTGSADPADWTGKLQLDVSIDGEPVAGALEAPGYPGVLLWRPAAPLKPGTYAAQGTVDNDDDYEYCAMDLDLDFEFVVDAAPAIPLTPPEVEATEVVNQVPNNTLAALVCCEGTIPVEIFSNCGGDGEIDYPTGKCAPAESTGSLAVTLSVAPKLPIGTVGLLGYSLLVDGESVQRRVSPQLEHRADEAFCTQVRVTNLASGESVDSPMQCHGAGANAAEIGPQPIDPRDMLECSALQTCELDAGGAAWDPGKCTPWPPDGESGAPTEGSGGDSEGDGSGTDSAGQTPGDDPKGCACDGRGSSGMPGSWGALGWLALGLMSRRRRAFSAVDRAEGRLR